MVATNSLEGRDLYFLSHDIGHGTASAPASHAGSAPSSPSVGPTHMDDLGYHHRKRKCLAADDHAHLPERAWSPKARSPLGHASSTGSERLPPMSSWSTDHHGRGGPRDENPYPSPRLPAILPATSSGRPSTASAYHHHHHHQPQPHRHHQLSQPHHQHQHQHHHHHDTGLPLMRPQSSSLPSSSSGLASLLNPSTTDAASSTAANGDSGPSVSTRSHDSTSELYAPAATRRGYGNALVSNVHHSGSAEFTSRSSASPVPSSPGRDSLYGNESPNRAGSVDGGSRPATPTSSGTLHMTPEERRRRRLERNRLAARECRQKKKVYVQELEDRMERMESENRRLRKEIEELNAKLTLGSMHLDRRGMFDEMHHHQDHHADDDHSTSMPPTTTTTAGTAAIDGASTGTDRSSASPVPVMLRPDGTVPTPPPSHSSYGMSHSNDILPRDLSVSPILPKPVVPLSHNRPHADSWSSV